MKKMIAWMLAVALLLAVCAVAGADPEYEFKPGCGTIRVISSPGGADIYADGEFTGATAPCLLMLPAGEHTIELKIPGYEAFSETVAVAEGQETELKTLLLPELPEGATVITVTTEADDPEDADRQFTVDSLGEEITLRQALIAVMNDRSGTAYRIEFADGVKRIEWSRTEFIRCDNLTINGDRNRDGTPDVRLVSVNRGGFRFTENKNLRVCGMSFDGYGSMELGPDSDECRRNGDVEFEDIYFLGCWFINQFMENGEELIAFGGACTPYDDVGAVNWKNLNCCGCNIGTANLFFAYTGNTDNSVTDGICYCANTLKQTGRLSVAGSDTNTLYIYNKPGDIKGNGGVPGQFRCCENNVIRNVRISGNAGGSFVLDAATGGNSNNVLEDVVVRNNYFNYPCYITCALLLDDYNVGNTLSTSGNRMERVTITRNWLDGNVIKDGPIFYMSVVGDTPADPSSTLIGNDNLMKDIYFTDNIQISKDGFDGWFTTDFLVAEDALPAIVVQDGIVICRTYKISVGDVENVRAENNRMENIVFSGNTRVEKYDRYVPLVP